jgi:2-desacetyl-2-hydroxyethyl bacteriochlorophyllide A dehydrogenase
MKVALFEKPHSLVVTTKSLRRLNEGEVLVKVQACGVCGTDVHIVEGESRSSPPVVLGHEFAGLVEDFAQGVKGFGAGQLVAVDPNISCGACYYFRRGLIHLCSGLRALGVDIDGGMAQYCIVPVKQVYEIPERLSAEESAFIEPVSCAIHGIDKAHLSVGDTVVIIGGGAIGLLMLQLARMAGAARVIVVEPQEHKRRIAQDLGADEIINPEGLKIESAIRDLTLVGADVVIECVGRTQTMQSAVEMARRGGTVEFFGVCPIGRTIPVEPNVIYYKELTVVGSYINPYSFPRAIAVLQHGKIRVDGFQIDKFPLDGVHEALARLREGRTIKSIIQPQA